MGTASPELMTPFTMRDLELSNRIVLAPMTRARAGQERLANEIMAEYFSEIAEDRLTPDETDDVLRWCALNMAIDSARVDL